MQHYRMRVYKRGDRQWQTHAILAPDDTTATDEACRLFKALGADLGVNSGRRSISQRYNDFPFMKATVLSLSSSKRSAPMHTKRWIGKGDNAERIAGCRELAAHFERMASVEAENRFIARDLLIELAQQFDFWADRLDCLEGRRVRPSVCC